MRHTVFVVILCLAVSAACLASLLYRTDGQFVYSLDDAYISMALAKNLAQHSVMGLTQHEFSFATSCPLWIGVIAAVFVVTGVNVWIPLILGLLFCVAAVLIASAVLRSQAIPSGVAATTLAAICITTALPTLAMSGMEHAMHIALVLLFCSCASRYLENDSQNRPALWFIGAIAPAMVMVRYESLFLIAVFGGLALLRGRLRSGILVAAAAGVPILVMGYLAVRAGWSVLPNSLLLKGSAPKFATFLDILDFLGLKALRALLFTSHVRGLMLLIVLTWIWRTRSGVKFWNFGQLLLVMTGAAILLHLQFASIGWSYRYENYLIALGVLGLGCSRFDRAIRTAFGGYTWRYRVAFSIAVACAVVPIIGTAAGRGIFGYGSSAYNLFEQQYQMAQFIHTYYDGATIAANDVGAVNYFNNVRCLDLVGLCNRDVFKLKRRGEYTPEAMEAIAASAGVRIALVYDSWFDGRRPPQMTPMERASRVFDTWFDGIGGPKIPGGWIPVGKWRVQDNHFLGGDTVTFYAVMPEEAANLARSLREFSPRLPAGVEVLGLNESAYAR